MRKQCYNAIDRPYRIDSFFDSATQEQQLSGYDYPGGRVAGRVAAFSANYAQLAEVFSDFSDTCIHIHGIKEGPLRLTSSFRLMSGNEGQHQGVIRNINFSADGKLLVSAANDQTVKIWDIETKRCTRTLRGHDSPAILAVFSPNNKQIASADSNGNLKTWDAERGCCQKTLFSSNPLQEILSIAFSSDGSRIVSAYSNGLLKVWDIKSETSIDFQTDCQKRLSFVKFSADGLYIEWDSSLTPDCPDGCYEPGEAEIYVWDANKGERLPNRSVTRDPLQIFSMSREGLEVWYKASSPVELLLRHFANYPDYPDIRLPDYWSALQCKNSGTAGRLQQSKKTTEAIKLIFNTTMAAVKGMQMLNLDDSSYIIYLRDRLYSLNQIVNPVIKKEIQFLFNQVLEEEKNPFFVPLDSEDAWLQKWRRAVEKWDRQAHS